MTHATPAATPSRPRLWTGRVVTGVTVLFLAFDSGAKILEAEPTVKAAAQLGFPPSATSGIGLLLAGCALLHLLPRAAALGAVLLTGYLGGAVASHVRAGNGVFPIVFTLAIGALVWTGLVLRRPAVLRTLLGRS